MRALPCLWPRASAALAAAMLAMILTVPAVSAANPPITFDLTIYGNCVGFRSGSPITSIVWRDSAGQLKAQGGPLDDGARRFCPDDEMLAVVPGDRITVSDGSYTRKYVVPTLSLIIDRVTNTAHGAGPAGRTVRLCSSWGWYWAWADCWSVRVGQDGSWSFDPKRDLHGGLEASLNWTSPNGDRLYLEAFSAQLGVTLGGSTFAGFAEPLADVQVSLHKSRIRSGTATADRYGYFSGTFPGSGGKPATVAVGNRVSAPALASDADWIVPAIEGQANRATDVVKGRCYDSGTSMGVARVSVVRPDGNGRGTAFRSTRSDGTFRLSFRSYFGGGDVPASANIRLGDSIWVDCLQTTGDWARLIFVVP